MAGCNLAVVLVESLPRPVGVGRDRRQEAKVDRGREGRSGEVRCQQGCGFQKRSQRQPKVDEKKELNQRRLEWRAKISRLSSPSDNRHFICCTRHGCIISSAAKIAALS